MNGYDSSLIKPVHVPLSPTEYFAADSSDNEVSIEFIYPPFTKLQYYYHDSIVKEWASRTYEKEERSNESNKAYPKPALKKAVSHKIKGRVVGYDESIHSIGVFYLDSDAPRNPTPYWINIQDKLSGEFSLSKEGYFQFNNPYSRADVDKRGFHIIVYQEDTVFVEKSVSIFPYYDDSQQTDEHEILLNAPYIGNLSVVSLESVAAQHWLMDAIPLFEGDFFRFSSELKGEMDGLYFYYLSGNINPSPEYPCAIECVSTTRSGEIIHSNPDLPFSGNRRSTIFYGGFNCGVVLNENTVDFEIHFTLKCPYANSLITRTVYFE